ncbi:excalibur calcium-binding domain-containing protein [Paragemmobacter straminiformis]|uniref:excalibur calcium-binding domain-containing protein n=1 Tax=Paragemmobacter straminiformis TaxID=2045119 RepID=UPI003BB143C0
MATLLAVSNAPATVTPSGDHHVEPVPTLIGLSCSPRKTCSKTVESCEEAYWLMENCSWGGKLDGDHDGVPCENVCPGG